MKSFAYVKTLLHGLILFDDYMTIIKNMLQHTRINLLKKISIT